MPIDDQFSNSFIRSLKQGVIADDARADVLIGRADACINEHRRLEKELDSLSSDGISPEFLNVVGKFEPLYKRIETNLEDLVMHGTAATKAKAMEAFEVFGPGENGRFAEVLYATAGNIDGAEDVIHFLNMKSMDDPDVIDHFIKGDIGLFADMDDDEVDPDYIAPDDWANE